MPLIEDILLEEAACIAAAVRDGDADGAELAAEARQRLDRLELPFIPEWLSPLPSDGTAEASFSGVPFAVAGDPATTAARLLRRGSPLLMLPTDVETATAERLVASGGVAAVVFPEAPPPPKLQLDSSRWLHSAGSCSILARSVRDCAVLLDHLGGIEPGSDSCSRYGAATGATATLDVACLDGATLAGLVRLLDGVQAKTSLRPVRWQPGAALSLASVDMPNRPAQLGLRLCGRPVVLAGTDMALVVQAGAAIDAAQLLVETG